MPESTDQAPSPPIKAPSQLKAMMVFGVSVILAAMVVAYWQHHHSYHLAVVQDGVLYRDGFKSPAQFVATLENIHPHTVVSLIDPFEAVDPKKPQLAAEAELCAEHRVTLDRIPVRLGGWPTSEDIQSFLKIVSDPQNQPVLVHCAQGVRRTGFFVAAYQESVLGYDKAKAESSILNFGHSVTTVDQIKRFIDGYDPKAETVPADLGRGTE